MRMHCTRICAPFWVQQNVNTNRCRPCRCHKMNLSCISKFNSTLHNAWFIFACPCSIHDFFLVVRCLIVTCVQLPQFHLFLLRFNVVWFLYLTATHSGSNGDGVTGISDRIEQCSTTNLLFFFVLFSVLWTVHIVHTTKLPNHCRLWFTYYFSRSIYSHRSSWAINFHAKL